MEKENLEKETEKNISRNEPEENTSKETSRYVPEGNATKESPEYVPLWKDILYLFGKLVGIILCFILLSLFVFGLCRNLDADMYPALKDGDLVIYYRLDKDYIASDCIVLTYDGRQQVRRVVAVEGDTVDITEQGLVINGQLQWETYVYEETQRYAEGVDFPITLQEGEVFVLGDARASATDSRIYGAVNVADTKGKVMLILRRRDF